MGHQQIKELLDGYVRQYNRPAFIDSDPISIPHKFSARQDIEIAGFFSAIFSWGQRKTIINKSLELMQLMDNAPYQFIKNHQPAERKRFKGFVHRTFQYTDLLYFLTFLQHHYSQHDSLEIHFTRHPNMKDNLIHFHDTFFSLPSAPLRTRKHVATPARKSTCKRLNMFLRWMVRSDKQGVDFGLWKKINPSQLMVPLDVHVERVAKKLNLLKRKQRDWLATEELTTVLRRFDPMDPTKYDFALFSIGVLEKEIIWP